MFPDDPIPVSSGLKSSLYQGQFGTEIGFKLGFIHQNSTAMRACVLVHRLKLASNFAK